MQDSEKIVLLRTMLLIRRFEERIDKLYMDGEIAGVLHLYIGEEAVGTGVISCLRKDDLITSTHRGHGHFLAKGADPNRMMAELLGRATGYCNGKGGSMHVADITLGHLGANGIVGGGLSIATGAALACKIRRDGKVVVCFFGDGASNTGEFHESLNMAALLNLPVVFVCENNRYAISVCVDNSCAVPDIATRAAGYGIPGVTVDGMDVLAVKQEAAKLIDRARDMEGPSLMVCNTYRFCGHSRTDPATYRSQEEVEAWQCRCPIVTYRSMLLAEKAITPSELEEMEKDVEAEIGRSVEFARSSPYPGVETLNEDVYA